MEFSRIFKSGYLPYTGHKSSHFRADELTYVSDCQMKMYLYGIVHMTTFDFV